MTPIMEHRRYLRANAPLNVTYTVTEQPRLTERTLGEDISVSGVRLRTFDRVQAGTVLSLALQMPFDSLPLFVQGQVAWMRPAASFGHGPYELGVRFLRLPEMDKRRLSQYIDTHLQEQRQI